jgi:hypothetical protein
LKPSGSGDVADSSVPSTFNPPLSIVQLNDSTNLLFLRTSFNILFNLSMQASILKVVASAESTTVSAFGVGSSDNEVAFWGVLGAAVGVFGAAFEVDTLVPLTRGGFEVCAVGTFLVATGVSTSGVTGALDNGLGTLGDGV